MFSNRKDFVIKRRKRVDTTDFLDRGMGNASNDSRWSTDATSANVDFQHLDINNENNKKSSVSTLMYLIVGGGGVDCSFSKILPPLDSY